MVSLTTRQFHLPVISTVCPFPQFLDVEVDDFRLLQEIDKEFILIESNGIFSTKLIIETNI